ncbi:MAG TPA: four helix bundle protein [Ignavibacteriaceae bacterium]|nr:four helix bundle protein [Ignavibacteriaceae bacterium]
MKDKREYRGFRDLIVYQLSYKLSVEIFEITKSFPIEEKYSLTDQIRRSSRSVPTNISEAWSRRRYPKSFVSKLVDADGEASETTVWLDYSKDHKYINDEKHNYFITKYDEVSKMLHSMTNSPEKFCY